MGVLEKFRLNGKKAFITGGAGGIGKAMAQALLKAGADVAIVDINLEAAQAAVDELSDIGPKVIAVQADVTNEDAVTGMVDTIVDAFGRIDIAFANAGITMNIPAEDMSFTDWKKVIDLNLNSVFLTDKAAAKAMIQQGDGGAIVNTGSMSGSIVNTPQPQSSYNASKAAVIHLSKSLAFEWAQHNIRVNTISPGYIGTDLLYKNEKLKPLIPEWEAVTPQKRLGKPEDLQATAVLLASDASAYATGTDVIIDGGYTIV